MRRMIEVLRPGPLPPKSTKKQVLWEILLRICKDLFDKPNMLTVDVRKHIRDAHDGFDAKVRAELRMQQLAQAQASSSGPAPPLPSAIYHRAVAQTRGPTLSASQPARHDSGVPLEEEDDTRSMLAGVSISPSDSASVASTRPPIRPAYSLDLTAITEEAK